MVLSNIYIARHGYRANWLPPPHPKSPTGIDSDPPLAKHGEDQAQELAHYILSIEPKPQIIFSSPFYRCLQTAAPVAKILDISVELENGVGEWYKPDRPTIPTPATYDVLAPFFSELGNDWEPTVFPSNEGETEEDIFERCKLFLNTFIPKFEEKYPDIDTVLFVTHAATKIALGMAILGKNNVREPIDDEDTRLRAGACSLSRYSRSEEDDNIWEIQMNGNTEFLTEGEEMHWDFLNGFEAGSDEDIKQRLLKQSQHAQQQQQAPDDQEEYEDVYVTLDIPRQGFNAAPIPPTAKMQVSGLHTEHPLFKVDGKIYEGDWQKLVGTEVVVTEDIGEVYKVKDRIKLEEVAPRD